MDKAGQKCIPEGSVGSCKYILVSLIIISQRKSYFRPLWKERVPGMW